MILAKDLRIGNKFLGIAGIQTVLDISDNTNRGKIEYVSESHKQMYSHLIQVDENRNQYKPCEIDGIPITKDWLISFSKSQRHFHDGVVIYEFGIFEFWQQGDSIWLHREFKEWLPLRIDFIHELQNLYFSLTGTELHINI